MRFFVDNNISPRIAKALNALEERDRNEVVHLKQKFDQSVSDIQWLSSLGQEGHWVVLTCDRNILRNPHERAAWKESGLTVFFFKESYLKFSFWDQAWQLIKKWPEIKERAEKSDAGSLFVLGIPGTKIEKIN